MRFQFRAIGKIDGMRREIINRGILIVAQRRWGDGASPEAEQRAEPEPLPDNELAPALLPTALLSGAAEASTDAECGSANVLAAVLLPMALVSGAA